MADLLSFCRWLFRWLVAKPTAWFFSTLRQELRRYLRRRPPRARR